MNDHVMRSAARWAGPPPFPARRVAPFSSVLIVGAILLLAGVLPPPALAEDFPTLSDPRQYGDFDELHEEEPTGYESEYPADPETTPFPEEGLSTYQTEEPPAQPVAPQPPSAPVAPPPIRLSQKVVMIGRPPYISFQGLLNMVKGLTAFLKKEMGVKGVRVVTAKDYAGVLAALDRGTIDFAWLGPTAFAIGSEKTPLLPLAQARLKSGSTYRGVFFTRKDSGILGIEDVRGRSIGFVDPESASGYLYPLLLLKRSKINPHRDCRNVEFLKKHDAILAAVLARKIDVGVCLEEAITGIRNPKIRDQILILGKTDPVPSDIVACRVDCHPSLRDKFKEALMKTGTLNQTASGSTGLPHIMEFVPVNTRDVESVRKVLKSIQDIRQP